MELLSCHGNAEAYVYLFRCSAHQQVIATRSLLICGENLQEMEQVHISNVDTRTKLLLLLLSYYSLDILAIQKS